MPSYWRKREQEHMQKMVKENNKLARRIREKHMQTLEEIQEQIDAFYGRYASREGLSLSEARKRARKVDIEKYEKKAKRYVKQRNFSPRANEEMRLYNLTMRVNRLELLKLNIELELLGLVSDDEAFLFNELTKSAREEFKRQSGILGETINFNDNRIRSIANSSFLSAEWSDRLWSNQVALRAELDRLLHRGIVQGINPRELARELRKTFMTSVYNAERLLRTEMARVQLDVQRDSFEQIGIDYYEYIAEPTACDICAELDGEILEVSKIEAGSNAPPMHPNCLCSTAGYVDREEFERELEARGL